jgi:hypothetical protein
VGRDAEEAAFEQQPESRLLFKRLNLIRYIIACIAMQFGMAFAHPSLLSVGEPHKIHMTMQLVSLMSSYTTKLHCFACPCSATCTLARQRALLQYVRKANAVRSHLCHMSDDGGTCAKQPQKGCYPMSVAGRAGDPVRRVTLGLAIVYMFASRDWSQSRAQGPAKGQHRARALIQHSRKPYLYGVLHPGMLSYLTSWMPSLLASSPSAHSAAYIWSHATRTWQTLHQAARSSIRRPNMLQRS